MANLLFTFALARRLENTGITVNAVHPGLARSGLMREGNFLMRLFTQVASAPPEKVTGAILQAATAPEWGTSTGRFLHNGKAIEAPAYAHDRAAQQRLWELSEQLTGLAATRGVTPVNDPHLYE
jgi:NAD(P)-dependent dehydrogenase (short-subunit alcohol dehydrogenase family)